MDYGTLLECMILAMGRRLQTILLAGRKWGSPRHSYVRGASSFGLNRPDGKDVTLCQQGSPEEAFQTGEDFARGEITSQMVEWLLQECARKKDLADGRRLQVMLVQRGYESHVYVQNALIRMFVTCGSLAEAYQVFQSLPVPNMYSWQTIISAHVQEGQNVQAINLFHKMLSSSVVPSEYVCVLVLKACANIAALAEGKLVHEYVKESGLGSLVNVGNALVAMYAKCGDLHEASRMFDSMVEKDVVSWTCMLGGHVRHGNVLEALQLFEKMKLEGAEANRVTYVTILKGCVTISALEHGKRIHLELMNKGFGEDIVIGNTLVDMYARCGMLDHAQEVFSNLPNRDVVSWTAMIAGYALHGNGHDAFQLLCQMEQQGVKANRYTYLSVLKACSNGGPPDLDHGKQTHARLVRCGLESDGLVQSTLIHMYVKCSSMDEARRVFERSAKGEILSWNALISGYSQQGHVQEALDLFQKMKDRSMKPDKITFLSALRACGHIGALDLGKVIHSEVISRSLSLDVGTGNALISMYLKCASINEANRVFDSLPVRDAASWTTIIRGHLQLASGAEALQLFRRMQEEGVHPNKYTFVSALGACSSEALIQEGRDIHVQISKAGLGSDLAVGNALIHMYAKCGYLDEARSVFKSLPRTDVVSWTTLICGCVQNAHTQEALQLFQKMQEEGTKPDTVTFLSILKACCSAAALDLGKHIHTHLIHSALESDVVVKSALLQMYTKCGDLAIARNLFESLEEKSLASWNTLVSGYVQHGHGQDALQLYEQLQESGLQPDTSTFVLILNACASTAALDYARHIHAQVITMGLDSDADVRNSLLDMYAKCGSWHEAWELFRILAKNVVTYNALIGGYAQCGHGQEALWLYKQMQQEGIAPNKITFLRLLKACGSVGDPDQAKQIHLELTGCDVEIDTTLGNALLDMYFKCQCLDEAWQVFRSIQKRDAITWVIMTTCCLQHGHNHEALQVFEQMQQEGKEPDGSVYVSFLRTCASLAALDLGEKVHFQAVKWELDSDAAVANALIDMYAKCGRLEAALKLFTDLEEKNVVTWTAMIGGYALHGRAQEALQLFQQMLQGDQRPNAVTFLSVLSACSHSGLVDSGRSVFKSMVEDYGIAPGLEHYGCMVDLLSRAGHLQEAVDVMNTMPVQPDHIMWLAVLGACQVHAEVELGRRAFDCVLKLKPQTAAAYDLMSNIYAANGRSEDQAQVREKSRLAGLKKVSGRTWMELGNQMHTFTPSNQMPEVEKTQTKGRESVSIDTIY